MGELIGGALLIAFIAWLLRFIPFLKSARWSVLGALLVSLLATAIAVVLAAIVGMIDPLVYAYSAALYTPIALLVAALRASPEKNRLASQRNERAREDAEWASENLPEPVPPPRTKKTTPRSSRDQSDQFINCRECDARNNVRREACWQCTNALHNE